MRDTKRALLLFGGGLLLGLVVVSAELFWLGRVASLAMAAGIVLLPVALFADGRRYAARPKPKPKVRPKGKPGTARRRQNRKR